MNGVLTISVSGTFLGGIFREAKFFNLGTLRLYTYPTIGQKMLSNQLLHCPLNRITVRIRLSDKARFKLCLEEAENFLAQVKDIEQDPQPFDLLQFINTKAFVCSPYLSARGIRLSFSFTEP
jgi:hypothetical protein